MLTLIRCPFHPRVAVVARIRPGHSAKSAADRFRLNTHTLSTQRSRSGLTMPLARHSVGINPELRFNDHDNRLIGAFVLVLLNRFKAPRGCYWSLFNAVTSPRAYHQRWRCSGLYFLHKPAEHAHSFLFCSSVYFCL